MGRSDAPAAPDRSAPKRSAKSPGARQRPRPDAEVYGGEVSSSLTSFDHLVGKSKQPVRHVKAERLGGLEVEHELEFGGLHDRQVGRPLALENAAGIDAGLAVGVGDAGSIADQPAEIG